LHSNNLDYRLEALAIPGSRHRLSSAFSYDLRGVEPLFVGPNMNTLFLSRWSGVLTNKRENDADNFPALRASGRNAWKWHSWQLSRRGTGAPEQMLLKQKDCTECALRDVQVLIMIEFHGEAETSHLTSLATRSLV
jgi:hypothetical protein